MLGAGVLSSVVVVVAEIPGCAGLYGLMASSAGCFATVDDGCPSFAESLVAAAVAAPCGGLSHAIGKR
jgi:hypothetical protein